MQQKAFKKLSTARQYANGTPIVQCGDFYIVGCEPLSEVRTIDRLGMVTGHISMSKLELLGNGNWAQPDSDLCNMRGIEAHEFNYRNFYIGDQNES